MSLAVVVDTDVLSYIFKGDSRGDDYQEYLEGRRLLISFQSLAELWLWAEIQNWGMRRRRQLEKFLDSFGCVHSTPGLCKIWSQVSHQARQNGQPILSADAWNATVAIALGIPLVTHNRSDYQGVVPLEILSKAPV